jgi:hypothetical protein
VKRKSAKRLHVGLPSIASLHQLVSFLNAKLDAPPAYAFGEKADNLDTLRAIQLELKTDVDRLLDPPPVPPKYSGLSPAEYWLNHIVEKINAIDFIPGRFVTRWTHTLKKGVLRLGVEKFWVGDYPGMDGTRDHAYWALYETLRSGDFSMLRRCPSCRKYFVTQRTIQQCCSRSCNTEYQNKRTGPIRTRNYRARKAERAKSAEAESDAAADEQRFAEFLNRTKGSVYAGSDLALFIKRKIPGDWRTVKRWHTINQAADSVWLNLPPGTKGVFREFWES